MNGIHYLPHDAINKSLQTGKSALEILQDLMPGLRFQIVPRVQHVLNGINSTRLALKSNVFMDEKGCADGIAALDNYRKRYNERIDAFTEEPLHDRYSNYADAFRQWGQGFDPADMTRQLRPRRRNRPLGGMWI